MAWLGLDIGGANLKAADGQGWARSVPFALWRDPAGLARALDALVDVAPRAERFAVTMTGELCDCFRTKEEGVRHILAAIEQVAGARQVAAYLVDGRLVPIDEARKSPRLAAASNWHALARFACRYLHGKRGLLIDVGSTTTDIVPLADGHVIARGSCDTERLVSGELVFSGVLRTPICAVTPFLPWRGRRCPVAAELFATTADAYVMLGDLPEEPGAMWTADGRPLTRPFARERLARMICADATELEDHELEELAAAVRKAQLVRLRHAMGAAVDQMGGMPDCFVVSGSGEFLAQVAVQQSFGDRRMVSLKNAFGPEVSHCAPAHALAILADAELG